MSSGLLVVDVQNGVVEGIESAAATIATIRELVTSARAHGRPVAWVQHEDTVRDDLPPGSARWEIVPELVPAPGDIRVVKSFIGLAWLGIARFSVI